MYITNKNSSSSILKEKPALIRSKTGAVVRALTCHQHGLGLIPAWCCMLLEFVVGSWLMLRGFSSEYSGFPPT